MNVQKKKSVVFGQFKKTQEKKRMNFKAMHIIMTFIKTNYGHGLA